MSGEALNATTLLQPADLTEAMLIARMGWPALSLRKTIGKVAVL